eukprot:CAMPEP_0197521758 /NCGR_PEP_ID=MMETSP1318-20131121/6973_1 /TAXON_ID=552666 /ORGANISM="Partenskyella glossopodia, Strain RCC365" /LENGTH=266 /DNA_ID=CAMNT_0043073871 /DNA_START=33 /DNA_END=833 /DNA_ORIENTATION=+
MDALPRRKSSRSDLGSLGGVLVGLLVLVAIGGAYSLRSYPVPSHVGSGENGENAMAAAELFLNSLLKEACYQVLNDSLSQRSEAGSSESSPEASGPAASRNNHVVDIANRHLSPEEFQMMLAFFGNQDNTRIPRSNSKQDYRGALQEFVAEHREEVLSKEMLRDVDCEFFADSMMGFISQVAPVPHSSHSTALLGAAAVPTMSNYQLSQTINLFGLWIHQIFKTVFVSLPKLAAAKIRAPRRRRGRNEGRTRGCMSCLGCASSGSV